MRPTQQPSIETQIKQIYLHQDGNYTDTQNKPVSVHTYRRTLNVLPHQVKTLGKIANDHRPGVCDAYSIIKLNDKEFPIAIVYHRLQNKNI